MTGNAALGVLAAALAGGLFNLFFGFLVISRRANQLASGLALMFCGVGLSALIGVPFVGSRIQGLNEIRIPVLSDLPLVGPMFFNYDILVYAAGPAAVLVWWAALLHPLGLEPAGRRGKPYGGLCRGKESPPASVSGPFPCRGAGGDCRGHLSIALAKTWQEWMTAGRGFIAVALVIFSKWHPLRAIVGALLFGGAIALQLQMQALGVPISPFLLDMLPYLLSLGGPGGLGRGAPVGGAREVWGGCFRERNRAVMHGKAFVMVSTRRITVVLDVDMVACNLHRKEEER